MDYRIKTACAIATCMLFLSSLVFAVPELHIEFENSADKATEFSGGGLSTITIASPNYASGQFVVDYLFSYHEKNEIKVGDRLFEWHEAISLDLSEIKAQRDSGDGSINDQLDEIEIEIQPRAISYKLLFDDKISETDLKGETIYFFGREYVVLDANARSEKVKLSPRDSDVTVDSGETITQNNIEVTLDGIYDRGADVYEAKNNSQK